MIIPWMKILLVALSSREIGTFFRRLGLPLITGFLITGIAVGPHGLHFFQQDDLAALRHLDRCALAFIAFAAGSELTLYRHSGGVYRDQRSHDRGGLDVRFRVSYPLACII
jgi:Kef-type K+ transport system membrane component KefB